jgi:hypothetical protein
LYAFFFAESHVQTEYGLDYLIEVSGSKLVSIVFQILGKKGADDLAFVIDVALMV